MLSLARWTLFCYCLFTDELIACESVTDNDNIDLLVGELHTKARLSLTACWIIVPFLMMPNMISIKMKCWLCGSLIRANTRNHHLLVALMFLFLLYLLCLYITTFFVRSAVLYKFEISLFFFYFCFCCINICAEHECG